MLILINKCLMNVAQHHKSIEWSKFRQAKFSSPHLSILLGKPCLYQGLFWELGAWVHFLGQISKKRAFFACNPYIEVISTHF